MNVKRFVSRIAMFTIILVVVFAGYMFYKYVSEKPPIREINLARESIAAAKGKHAGKYAGNRLKVAEEMFNEAMDEWTIQNNKFIIFRDFTHVKELATGSYNNSTNAQSEAGLTKDKYKQKLVAELNETENLISRFEKYYKHLPVGRTNFDRYNQGKLKYLEAVNDFKRNDYHQAMILVASAKEKLEQAEKSSEMKLERFYKDFADWQKNENLAVQLSKKGQQVVLVNKMDLTCAVLKGGKPFKVFEAEFGPNWMGDKIMKGDRTTPQGVYKITEKKRGVKTIYHKALLLNYPNSKDKIRFDKMKKVGSIPGNAHIGGLIEIHGGGGKGIHWTDGCIALNDKDMDVIYDLCNVGTAVVIIGSDKSMDEYFSSLSE